MIDATALVKAMERLVASHKIPCLAGCDRDPEGVLLFNFYRLQVKQAMRRIFLDGESFNPADCLDEICLKGRGFIFSTRHGDLVELSAVVPGIQSIEKTSSEEDLFLFNTALSVASDRRSGAIALQGHDMLVASNGFLPAEASAAICDQTLFQHVRRAIFGTVRYQLTSQLYRSGGNMMEKSVIDGLFGTADFLCGHGGAPRDDDGI